MTNPINKLIQAAQDVLSDPDGTYYTALAMAVEDCKQYIAMHPEQFKENPHPERKYYRISRNMFNNTMDVSYTVGLKDFEEIGIPLDSTIRLWTEEQK
jgi:predicted SAM-dependent methyltransferase